MEEKVLTLEELFEGYKGENPQREFEWGEDVGLERFWEDETLPVIEEALNKQNETPKVMKNGVWIRE